MIKKSFRYITIAFFAVLFFSTSCRKDKLMTDSSAKLAFSSNSILFDTVFTTVGSTTMPLVVHNNYKEKINISSIKLAGGNSSNFKINIDGTPATQVNNLEIAAKDSIYIFIKVTVNPNSSNSPFVISDSILFETNGNLQSVKLVAWGQNAYYYTPNHFPANFPPYSIIKCNDVWKNDKPHVIYGYAAVDTGCTLTIMENTRVYLHQNAVLWIYKDGTLKVEGELGNPVTFQGDRLENDYQNVPGQWGKIWITQGRECNINYAVIKNGIVGIQVDTLPDNCTAPALKITNTIIENMSAAGIFAQGSWVEGYNCVIGNCGQYAVLLNIGGKYNFKHCTIGNYWDYTVRQTASLDLNDWYQDIYNNYHGRDLNAYFGNCIVYGNLSEEIQLDKYTSAAFNYNFDHCLLKTQMNTSTSFQDSCNICIFNNDPLFSDYANNNYQLGTGSAAIEKGLMSIALTVPFDILRHNRTTKIAPDIGAYEAK
ncbi:MAG: hypothetical protein ABR968_12615 [Bacteroidales bacterium]|jgi:hypothetical protein